MKTIELQGGPGWPVYILLVLALYSCTVNLGWAADLNDDIQLYRQGAESRSSIGMGPASRSGNYSSYDDNARFSSDSAANAQQHQRFMDNEYGSQTPNPSCYLCNGY